MICNKFERLAPGQESLVMSRLHITSSGKMKLQLLHLEFMFILKWVHLKSFQFVKKGAFSSNRHFLKKILFYFFQTNVHSITWIGK